jgi:hypothetical protein
MCSHKSPNFLKRDGGKARSKVVELNNFSMMKVVLIQWKSNQRVIGFVPLLTRTSAELGIALSYFVSFAVPSPTWRS